MLGCLVVLLVCVSVVDDNGMPVCYLAETSLCLMFAWLV